MSFIVTFIAAVFVFSAVIAIHEFGHFAVAKLCVLFVFHRRSDLRKCGLVQTAVRANPILRDFFKRCAGGNAIPGIADGRIIDVAAGTFVFHA